MKTLKLLAALSLPFAALNGVLAFDIVAHRGENSQAPMNSLEAFALAWKNGAKYVEADFYFTDSSQIVCAHCRSTLKELSGIDCDIEKLSPEQVSSANLASGKWSGKYGKVTLPLMSDVFKAVPPGGVIVVEIKNFSPKFAEEIERLRKQCGLKKNQIVIISFNKKALADFTSKCSGYQVYLLHSLKNKNGIVKPTAEDLIAAARKVGANGVDLGGTKNIDASYVEKIKKAGLKFWVWTVNDFKEALRLGSIGIDAITTDKSAEFINLLKTENNPAGSSK